MSYSKLDDIENQLKKQWGSYFQRLLKEQNTTEFENKNFNSLSDQINDIKVALLSTLSNDDAKIVARGTIKFRRLIDTINALKITKKVALNPKLSFLELLQSVNIKSLLIEEKGNMRNSFIFIKKNKTILSSRYSLNTLFDTQKDWTDFTLLKEEYRDVIYDTLEEMSMSSRGFRIFLDRNQTLKKYLNVNVESEERSEVKKLIKPIEDVFNV